MRVKFNISCFFTRDRFLLCMQVDLETHSSYLLDAKYGGEGFGKLAAVLPCLAVRRACVQAVWVLMLYAPLVFVQLVSPHFAEVLLLVYSRSGLLN